MTCRYCEAGTDLVEAHVIPAGFFRRLRDPNAIPKLLSNREGERPRRAPNGVYDRHILGSCCEPTFGPWDQHAQEVLLDDASNATVLRVENQIVGYEISRWDYRLLKLFFISLAWRASVSTHPMYSRISLGPYEARARDLLQRADPGASEDFAVFLAKFDHAFGGAILDPHRERNERVNYLRFYLGTYIAYIKVDRQKTPHPYASFVVGAEPILKVVGRDITKSPELHVMRDIVLKSLAAKTSSSRTG